ncbi:arginine/serine-rich protein 1-like isoform X1 [Choloepus didactylus]|uniref:arginine/serine-rich protein 1-like isoform X1 n=1 Tax=Choloepus didactylus TaxID=27675 RepID=UPI00189CFAFA|nr:arginine/serine-rich protein 1-like isoform X1 [Choloepus didactylus]
MSNYVNDMWPGSPQKDSPSTSGSGQSCRLSSSRSSSRLSSRSARSGSRVSSRSSSRSRSRPRRRSRSRSRCRRRHQRTYRRYSRSYSRSRSLSRSRRHRERHRGSSRRCYGSPLRYRSRSRSRSRGRSCYRRAYAVARGRRCYGFGRRVYPEEYGSRRARSRTRSRSRSPFRLSEKERMELLEIAKANAAKALGTAHLDLPASLRTASVTKEKNCETASPNDGAEFKLLEKLTEDGTKNRNEKSSQQRSIAFSAYNSVAKPIFQKSAKATVEDTSSGSPKLDKKKSPYELWVPV